ncbi:hypothetical protein ZWY2020_003805, partial [Hordeum vulgare]
MMNPTARSRATSSLIALLCSSLNLQKYYRTGLLIFTTSNKRDSLLYFGSGKALIGYLPRVYYIPRVMDDTEVSRILWVQGTTSAECKTIRIAVSTVKYSWVVLLKLCGPLLWASFQQIAIWIMLCVGTCTHKECGFSRRCQHHFYLVRLILLTILPGNGARNPSCYFLSLRWFSLEEERVMQQS